MASEDSSCSDGPGASPALIAIVLKGIIYIPRVSSRAAFQTRTAISLCLRFLGSGSTTLVSLMFQGGRHIPTFPYMYMYTHIYREREIGRRCSRTCGGSSPAIGCWLAQCRTRNLGRRRWHCLRTRAMIPLSWIGGGCLDFFVGM